MSAETPENDKKPEEIAQQAAPADHEAVEAQGEQASASVKPAVNKAADKAAQAAERKAALKKARQITIDEHGQVFYQPDPTNPTAGIAVGAVTKGADWLTPNLTVTGGGSIDPAFLNQALFYTIDVVLFAFKAVANASEGDTPVAAICKALYEAGGLIARADVAQHLSALTPETRAELRQLGVRLGPLYISCPEMNKPEPLGLRGVLWALYQGMTLPAATIPQGAVSFKLDEAQQAQSDFYAVMGYPVYAGRGIRVDMLERVTSAAYDSADKGVFRAQHGMAEWLGVPIDDLYGILEALGHRKIEDAPAVPAPEDKVSEETAEEKSAEQGEEAVKSPAEAAAEAAPAAVEKPAEQAPAPTPAPTQEKPLLALFQLKPGQGRAGAKKGGKPAFKGGKKDAKHASHKKGKKPAKGGHKGGAKDRGFKQKDEVLKFSPFASALSGLKGDD